MYNLTKLSHNIHLGTCDESEVALSYKGHSPKSNGDVNHVISGS
jgi:hypothetical protein